MDREMEYYGQFGSLHCSEPDDKPSIDDQASAGEDEEGILGGKITGEGADDEEEAASATS